MENRSSGQKKYEVLRKASEWNYVQMQTGNKMVKNPHRFYFQGQKFMGKIEQHNGGSFLNIGSNKFIPSDYVKDLSNPTHSNATGAGMGKDAPKKYRITHDTITWSWENGKWNVVPAGGLGKGTIVRGYIEVKTNPNGDTPTPLLHINDNSLPKFNGRYVPAKAYAEVVDVTKFSNADGQSSASMKTFIPTMAGGIILGGIGIFVAHKYFKKTASQYAIIIPSAVIGALAGFYAPKLWAVKPAKNV